METGASLRTKLKSQEQKALFSDWAILQPLKDTDSLLLDHNFSIFKIQEGKKGKGGTHEKEGEGG